MSIQQDEIIHYALSSKNNLELSIIIGQSYEKLRTALIKDFAKHLEQELKNFAWDTDFKWWLDTPTKIYTGFTCRRKNWPSQLSILIESQLQSGNYIYGVLKDKDTLTYKFLINALTNIKGKGKETENWVWYQFLPAKFRDFTDKETLCLLYEKQEFTDYLISEIESLGDLIDDVFLEKGVIHERVR